MDKRQLIAYRANKRRIDRLSKKIEDEDLKDFPVVAGKVKGSAKEFPYIERRFGVLMEEPDEKDDSLKRIKRLRAEKERAEKACLEVEQFISSIKDEIDRELFEFRFIDGLKVIEVAEKVGYTHGRVSQKISKYLKD